VSFFTASWLKEVAGASANGCSEAPQLDCWRCLAVRRWSSGLLMLEGLLICLVRMVIEFVSVSVFEVLLAVLCSVCVCVVM